MFWIDIYIMSKNERAIVKKKSLSKVNDFRETSNLDYMHKTSKPFSPVLPMRWLTPFLKDFLVSSPPPWSQLHAQYKCLICRYLIVPSNLGLKPAMLTSSHSEWIKWHSLSKDSKFISPVKYLFFLVSCTNKRSYSFISGCQSITAITRISFLKQAGLA